MKQLLLSIFIISCSLSITIAQPPNNLSSLKICIDPGHGGYGPNDRHVIPDPGLDFWESESNWNKALLLKPMLEARGATVILTRTGNNYPDQQPSLTARWTLANNNNVHWFHSIHSNAGGGTYTCVLLKENISTRQAAFPEAIKMSSFIYNNIRAKLRTSAAGGNVAGYPGVYLDYTFYSGAMSLGVLSGLIMPGELSEGSFHDSFPETRRLLNNDYRKTEAYAIINGFVEYYKIPYDTLGMIIGSQKDGVTPINNIVVRLLPNNKIYNGDSFNNGFFLFDSLPSGNYKVVYETPGFAQDTVLVTLTATGRIATTIPVNDQTGLSRNSTIIFNFTRQMDTAYVRSIFSINPAVAGTLSWNTANTVMSFTPNTLLSFKTNYVATLAGLGNTLQPAVFVDNKTITSNVAAKPLSVSFTTISLPPSITNTQPLKNDTNFVVTKPIGLLFSESMDTVSVRSALSIIPAISYTLSWINTNTTVLITPVSKSFAYSTNYTVSVDQTAKSIYGFILDGNKDSVAGDPFILQFRTQTQPAIVASDESKPFSFALSQNYPNPFNPTTIIGFSIADLSSVSLTVYDILGREITSLVNGRLNEGKYSIQWDGKKYSSGMYFYKLSTEKFTSIKRMMLVK